MSFPLRATLRSASLLCALELCGAGSVALIMPLACLGQSTNACDPKAVFAGADRLLKLKEYARASAELDRLQGCRNMPPANRFALGWLYGRAHDFKNALRVFQSVEPDFPDRATHEYAIALTQFELGDYEASIKTLTTLQSERRLDGKSATLLGVAYSKLGRYADAYPILAEDLDQNPNELFAYLNLITLFAETGHVDKAVDIADKAVTQFPQSSEVFVVRGAAHSLLGKMDRAHDDFQTAVELAPRRADPRFFLALSDYKRGKFAEARTELQASIKAGIVDSDLHYLLAECMLKLDPDKPPEAIVELNRAIGLNSRSGSARTLRGRLLLEAGHAQQAILDLKLAYEIEPKSRSAIYSLARADFMLGKSQEAKALFSQLNSQSVDGVAELSERRLQQAVTVASSQ